jgi:hypothetical protein
MTFELTPGPQPDPAMLDADPVTKDWPMPLPKAWVPVPKSLWESVKDFLKFKQKP